MRSRVRADVVYVAWRPPPGERWIDTPSSIRIWRGPPRSTIFYWANSAHLSLIQNKDLAAQIGTFLLGKQCAFIPYRKLGPQILLYCWSQQYKRNGCTNSLILLRPTVYLYWRPFWPPSHQVVDPLLQWVPVALSLPRRGLQVVGPGLDLPVCSVPLPLSAQPRPWRNFVKFGVILWNFVEFWWNLAEFCEILRSFGKILWNLAEFYEIWWHFCEIWRNFMKFCGILWISAEFRWNFVKFGGILWNWAEFCEI